MFLLYNVIQCFMFVVTRGVPWKENRSTLIHIGSLDALLGKKIGQNACCR